jgi:predicted nucleotidyltransferase
MEDQEEVLSQIVAALREGLGERLVAMVLYGSRARGQAREASDWDLFIIATDLPKQLWERHILLKGFLPPTYRAQYPFWPRLPRNLKIKFPPSIWILPMMVKFSLTPKDMLTFGSFAAPDGRDGTLS